MNINSSNIEKQTNVQNMQNNTTKQNAQNEDVNFSTELNNLKNQTELEEETSQKSVENLEANVVQEEVIKKDQNKSDLNQVESEKTTTIEQDNVNNTGYNDIIVHEKNKNEIDFLPDVIGKDQESAEPIEQEPVIVQPKDIEKPLEQESAIVQSKDIEKPLEQKPTIVQPKDIEKPLEQEPVIDQSKDIEKSIKEQQEQKIKNDSIDVKANSGIKEQTENKSGDKEVNSDKVINQALENLSSVFQQLNKNEVNQKDEKEFVDIKVKDNFDDKNNEENNLINNDYNITDKNQINPQMNPNMNFSGDGQPFSSFMGEEQQKGTQNNIIGTSRTDLEEEAKVLSTMEENLEIANKNVQNIEKTNLKKELVTEITEDKLEQSNEAQEKIVNRNDGIKKVDVQSGVTIETVVKYDNIIMNEADVEVFVDLVQNNEVNINNLKPEAATKSVHVSKTLADMLVKAQETNQPLRIDFDNNISVIIRISRDGKLSADFLPSSQVAEAYLKENLPLLRQKFEDNNIEYDELNQRNSRDKDRESNKRKERNNE